MIAGFIFYLQNYVIFLLALALLYGLGYAFLRWVLPEGFVKKPFYYQVFFSCWVGLVIFVSIFAIWKTALQTVHIFYLLLGGFVLWELRLSAGEARELSPPHIPDRAGSRQHWFFFLLASLLVYTWGWLEIYQLNTSFPFKVINPDNIFYAHISYYLQANGQENEFYILNELNGIYQGNKPYHYLELWLNAGLSELFWGNYAVNLVLLTLPVAYFMALVGLRAIAEFYQAPNYLLTSLAVLLCFFLGGICLDVYATIQKVIPLEPLVYAMSYFIGASAKIAFYQLFFVAFLLCIFYRRLSIALIALMGMPIGDIVTFPAIMGSLWLLYGLSWVWKANFLKPWREVRIGVYLFAITVGLPLFYFFLDTTSISREGTKLVSFLELVSLDNLRTKLNLFIGISFYFGLSLLMIYAVHLFLLFSFGKKIYRLLRSTSPYWFLIILFNLCVMFFGLLAWTLLYEKLNSFQMPFYTVRIIFNVTWIWLVMVLLINYQQLSRFGIFILMGALMTIAIYRGLVDWSVASQKTDRYHADYLKKIETFAQSQPEILFGGFIRAAHEYGSLYGNNYVTVRTLGEYLAFMQNGWVPVSMSDYAMEINEQSLGGVSLGIFYQFVEAQKQAHTFESLEQSQVDFIDHYQIKYLIVSSGAKISPLIQQRAKTIWKDQKSGERFMLLDTLNKE